MPTLFLCLQLTYSQAMTAIFIEGWIFVILSVTGVRGGIVKYMPKNIAMATSGGCGGGMCAGMLRGPASCAKGALLEGREQDEAVESRMRALIIALWHSKGSAPEHCQPGPRALSRQIYWSSP